MRKTTTGTPEYVKFVQRIIRSYGKKARTGAVDTETLRQLVELRETLDDEIEHMVHALRSDVAGAHSWAHIGEAVGMTRAAAYKRFGNGEGELVGARVVGGQPCYLR